jgi:hypothetical protein
LGRARAVQPLSAYRLSPPSCPRQPLERAFPYLPVATAVLNIEHHGMSNMITLLSFSPW